MECLGLHNKSTAEVYPVHKLTGPKEEEEEGEVSLILSVKLNSFLKTLHSAAVSHH
jgi:hypothetical protein